MDEQRSQVFEFDNFQIDALRRRLKHLDKCVHLSPKVFDTLLTLVRQSGRVLEKDELIEAVWPDTIVEENNLTQNISAIRKALGDNRGDPRYVVTIPGRGYSFVADVRELPRNGGPKTNGRIDIAPQPSDPLSLDLSQTEGHGHKEPQTGKALPSSPATRFLFSKRHVLPLTVVLGCLTTIMVLWSISRPSLAGPVTAPRSIAVLPFESMNAEGADEYIGTGMADALITKLGNIRQITVRPTSSVSSSARLSADPLVAGRELGVDCVIVGHVQRLNERLRVTVQMIRTSDGSVLWARGFDEKFTDVFAMQDSISEQAASALQLKLTGDEHRQIVRRHTENTEAYLAFMKAVYSMNQPVNEKVRRSVDYFQQAIDLDPNYALAYAGLADAYMRFHARGISSDKGESISLARAAVNRAIELDETVAYAHSMLGFIAFRYEWDLAKAEREYKRARELDPNYVNSWFGFYLITVNRPAEAEAEFARYREAHPLDGSDLSLYYYFIRQYDAGENELKNALDIDPNNGANRANLGLIYEQKGMLKEAVAEFKKSLALTGNKRSALLAHCYAISGRTSEARQILDEIAKRSTTEYFSANYTVAVINAGLGEKDEAITYLEKAFDEHSLGPAWFRFDPRLDGLRSDPRFQQLMRRTGLPL